MPNAKVSQDLDISRPLQKLRLFLQDNVLAGGGASILHDGRAGTVIDNIAIGGGKDTVFECDGYDLFYVLYTLNKQLPSEVLHSAVAGPNISSMTLDVPISLNPGQIVTPKMKVQWGADAYIGADQGITAAQIDGSYVHVNDKMVNHKTNLLTLINQDVRFKAQLDAGGRLVGVLLLSYDNSTPFDLLDSLTQVDLQIEGEIAVKGILAEQLRQMWNQHIGSQAVPAGGVYYMDLDDYNIVPGVQSFIRGTLAGPVDLKMYEFFERIPGKVNAKQTAPSIVKQKNSNIGTGNKTSPIRSRNFL